jgi:hypothetical protein
VFTRFLRETQGVGDDAHFEYLGLAYDPGAAPPGDRLRDGAVNAILDFRYSTSDRLSWYFDHHVSAFQEPGSEQHYLKDVSGRKFHDGAYGSCTKFIVDVAKQRFGWDAPDLADLVRWSDVIDAARFASAEEACSFEPPHMQVSAVVQEQGDDALCRELIPMLGSMPLAAVAASPLVSTRLAPIRARHEALARRMEQCGEQRNNVAWFDLSEAPVEAVAKFVGYQLFPTAMYSVVLSRTPKRVKISVGFNPWSKRPRAHNIAALCERYGGGGHPVVGAVSLAPQELARARAACDDIVRSLNT